MFVYDQNKFVALLSIGDIQHAIMENYSLNDSIAVITRKKTIYAKSGDSKSDIIQEMLNSSAECMPIVNNKNELVDIHFGEDVFSEGEKRKKSNKTCQLL